MEGRQYVVAVGSDDAGVNLKNFIRDQLSDDPRVEDVLDFGVADADDKTAYPVICIRAAEAVARGEADRAVLFGGTGLGEAISANKVRRDTRRSRPRSLLHREVHSLQQLPGALLGRACDRPRTRRSHRGPVAGVRVRSLFPICRKGAGHNRLRRKRQPVSRSARRGASET